jgi:hypothetical protein
MARKKGRQYFMQAKTKELSKVLTERKRKKVKKVIKGLNKASKLHAGQAKTLRGVIGAKKKKRS